MYPHKNKKGLSKVGLTGLILFPFILVFGVINASIPYARSFQYAKEAPLYYTCERVISGDQLLIHARGSNYVLRIKGIDAPPLDSPWGQTSQRALQIWVFKQPLQLRDISRSGTNMLAHASLYGVDIGKVQLEYGMARSLDDKPHAYDYIYRTVEKEAQKKQLGIWKEHEPTSN